jgi:cyclophilin family peptidyl-prolyl cis-trans isomerase
MNHCIAFGQGMLVAGLLAMGPVAWGQDSAAAPPAQAAPVAAAPAGQGSQLTAAEAKAQFDQRFAEYQNSIRAIEKLRTDYQTAGGSGQKTINHQLHEKLIEAKKQLDAMVAAGMECYRVAPKENPQLGQLLAAVAKYYTVGEASPQSKDEKVGGDNYERALPIVKLLIDSGSDDKRLPLWGFLAAFAVNDYDLAEAYLKQAQSSGALTPTGDDQAEQELLGHVMQYAQLLPQYRELWTKEQAIRAAEAQADDLPRVKFETSKGPVVIELFENEAPQAVANFITLVKSGYYNGLIFHRVLPMFMAQGGDPEGTGSGGPGYSIRCECYGPNYRHHFRGSLSMAHAGRDTGGSQFFLTFVPTPHLDGRHTVFGRVVEGMDVLGELEKRNPEAPGATPPDKIIEAEVLRDRGHEYAFEKLPGR